MLLAACLTGRLWRTRAEVTHGYHRLPEVTGGLTKKKVARDRFTMVRFPAAKPLRVRRSTDAAQRRSVPERGLWNRVLGHVGCHAHASEGDTIGAIDAPSMDAANWNLPSSWATITTRDGA